MQHYFFLIYKAWKGKDHCLATIWTWHFRVFIPALTVQDTEILQLIKPSNFKQVSRVSCEAQLVTFSTRCTTRWTRTWTSPSATTSSPPLTTRTWPETSSCPTPRPTCTPGCCNPAVAAWRVSAVRQSGYHAKHLKRLHRQPWISEAPEINSAVANVISGTFCFSVT